MSAIPSSPHMKIIVTRGGIKMIELTKKTCSYREFTSLLSKHHQTVWDERDQSIGPHVSYLTLK